MDMERHLITIEELTVPYATSSNDQRSSPSSVSAVVVRRIPAPVSTAVDFPISPTPLAVGHTTTTTSTTTQRAGSANTLASTNGHAHQPENDTQPNPQVVTPLQTKRKKWRPPQAITPIPTTADTAFNDEDQDALDSQEAQRTFPRSIGGPFPVNPALGAPTIPATVAPKPTLTTTIQAPKRRKVGLSGISSARGLPMQSPLTSLHRPPNSQLEFPTAARCANFTGKNSSQLLRRSLTLGSRFASINQYKDGMTFLIYEHLQILVIEIAIAMWNIKTGPNTREPEALDATYRCRGIPMHFASTLRRRGDVYAGFPVFSERGFNGVGSGSPMSTTIIQPSPLQGLTLTINNKEHHSKYVRCGVML